MSPLTAQQYADLPEVLTAEEVALILDTSAVQVRRWAADSKIPATRIGRTYRFSKRAIEAHIRGEQPIP